MKKRSSILFIASLIGYSSSAQDITRYLTLKEAVTASISNNDAIKSSVLDEQIASVKFKQTGAILLPQAKFSYTAFTTNNPLNAFGFKLQQGSITEVDFNPKQLNHPSATPDFSARLELQQPLVNIDLLYQRKGAAKQVEMYHLISQRTREYLSFETGKTYLELQMLYDADKVLKNALTASKAVYKISKDYYDQGLVQKSDLLNAELHVMNIETQLKGSQSNIQDASDELSLLMGELTGKVYTVDPITQNINLVIDSLQLPDDRTDFKALQKGIEGYDMISSPRR